MLLKFRHSLKPCLVNWAKKRKSWGLTNLHLHIRLTLSVWKFWNHVCSPAILCDWHLSLSFSFIGGTKCPRVPSTILLSFKATMVALLTQSQRSCSTLNLEVGSSRFSPLIGFFEDENGQEVFLHFHLDIKKFDKNESYLATKQPDWEYFTCTNEISHHNLPFTWQLVVNFN